MVDFCRKNLKILRKVAAISHDEKTTIACQHVQAISWPYRRQIFSNLICTSYYAPASDAASGRSLFKKCTFLPGPLAYTHEIKKKKQQNAGLNIFLFI
jgi:hypothetical protein